MTAMAIPPLSPPAAPPGVDPPFYEVVGGETVEIPALGVLGVVLVSDLQLLLGAFVKQHRLGRAVVEGLFILDAEGKERRRPDIAFVSAERWPLDRPIPEKGDWAIAPDLAIEVISPNEYFCEVMTKLQDYFRYGVRQVWLVAPATRLVFVFDNLRQVRIVAEADELTDTIVPGFTLKLGELFPPRAS